MLHRLAAVVALLAVCCVAASSASATVPPPPLALSASNMNQLSRYSPDLQPLLNRAGNYAIGNPSGTQVGAPNSAATPTLIYRSLAQFRSDVANRRIDSRIGAVVYDPEAWSSTPLAEQQDPIKAITSFAALAHQRGYRFIAVPGRDLMLVSSAVCFKQRGETLDQAYLRCRIPARAAAVSDVFVVQAQADECDPARMYSLVSAAASQVRSANPSVRFYSTVSSESPSGANVTDQTMITAFSTVGPLVDGFWVNVFPSQTGDLEISSTALHSLLG